VQRITRALREIRSAAGVPLRDPLKGAIKTSTEAQAHLQSYINVAERLALVSLTVDPQATALAGSASKVVGDVEIFIHDVIDEQAEKERLNAELSKVDKEITACEKKLGNARFVDRAPAAVVEKQRDRLAGYQANREALLRNIEKLSR
jgi:valyl-tRNA synthetase